MKPIKLDYSRTALLIVDVQNDFCPKGALEVKNGDRVIEPLNSLSSLFFKRSGRIIATQDWHPANHLSFASSHENKNPGDTVNLPGVRDQILWPDHCVQGSRGAEFHENLDIGKASMILRKGFRSYLDSYSAFFENDRKTSTGLDGFLKTLSIDTLILGGLALDYCVFYSAWDAASLGYHIIVVGDAVLGVNIPSGSCELAIKNLDDVGVIIADSKDIQ